MENVCEITNIYGTFRGPLNKLENKSPWLIFLHGFPDDSSAWSFQWEELKSSYNIWCPDLFMHSFSDQIKGLADFISTHSGDSKVILIGHDMGGPVACEIARKYPEMIHKVLLINTLSLGQFLSRWNEPRQWIKSSYMPLFMGPLHSTKWWHKLSKNFLNLAYDLGGLTKDDPLRNHSEASLEGIKRYREALKAAPFYLASPGKKLRVETHFLFGEYDRFMITPDKDELEKYYNHFSLVSLPAGHWPQRTHSREVNQWIQRTASDG